MKIETKLNIDDDCYFLENNRISKGQIKKIQIAIDGDWCKQEKTIYYTISIRNSSFILDESKIFGTIEELLTTLGESVYE